MKNALLALALFAFVGTASAHDGEKDGKKAKKTAAAKSHCGAGATAAAGTPSCCMKKGAATSTAQVQTTDAKPATPAAAPAVKTM